MFKVAINSEADQKEQPSLKERALKAFSPEVGGAGISALLLAATNLENHYTDQSAPVGEMLADYAIEDLGRKGMKYQYYQAPERSNLFKIKGLENLSAILFSPFSPGPTTHTTKLHRDASGKLPKITREQSIAMFGAPRAKSIASEMQGIVFPDKLQKSLLQGDDTLAAVMRKVNRNIPEEKLLNAAKEYTPEAGAMAESLLRADANSVKGLDGIVIAPRNNQRAIAHEFGHVYDSLGSLNPPKSEFLKKVKSIGKKTWKLLGSPMISNLPASARVSLENAINKLPSQPVRDLTKGGLGLYGTIPGNMVTATKLISTFKPEWGDKMEENDPTGLVKFINDNPALAATIVNMPHTINELSTTIPGTKLVYNFWKDFNDGKLNKHVFAKDVAKAVGKKSPIWEAAKFFGKNILTTAAPVYAPLVAMYAYDKYKNSEDAQ